MTKVMLPYVGNQDITVSRPDASFDRFGNRLQ
jgi:hypothetical protein